jgi:glycosyltransferase involved in cell wall biosynthesis
MKIVYDHQIFSQQRYGGVGRYFFELASQLHRNPGLEVKIEAPLYVSEQFQNARLLPTGIKVPKLRYTATVIKKLNEAVLRTRRDDVDVVHETYYQRESIGFKSAPRVITVLDMIHELFPAHFPSNDDTSKRKLAAAQRAARVICISHSTRRDLMELFGIPAERIDVVHLASSMQPDKACPRSPEQNPYILQVGARGGYKNFMRAAQACAPLLRDSRGITLVCFGGPPFSPFESSELSALGILQRVKQVSGSDKLLATYYKHAIGLIYPSLYEGFGLPPLEAMSMGCPVITSTLSSIPEVVGDAAATFEPTDVNSIRAAVTRVLDSSQLREELRKAGLERARNFSWERTAAETLRCYGRVVN